MDGLFDLPPEATAALGTLAGFALMGGLSTNQQNSLGNLLELVGQVLLASAAQRQLLEQQATNNTAILQRLEALERRLDRIEGSAHEG